MPMTSPTTLTSTPFHRRGANRFGVAFAALCALVAMADPSHAQLADKISRSIAGAQRFESQRNFRDALAIYDHVLGDATLLATGEAPASDPRQAMRRRARLFENVRDFERAEDDLTVLATREPADASALSDRGFFYMRRGRYYDAAGDFAAAIRIDPDDPALRYAAGRARSADGDIPRALAAYDEALGIDPKFSRAVLARAEAKVHLGQFDDAGRDYERAIALGLSRRQDKFFAYLGRGYVALRTGRYDAAAMDFDAALVLDATSAHALAWRAHANEMRGRNDLALGDYETAAPLLPENNKIGASLRRLRSK